MPNLVSLDLVERVTARGYVAALVIALAGGNAVADDAPPDGEAAPVEPAPESADPARPEPVLLPRYEVRNCIEAMDDRPLLVDPATAAPVPAFGTLDRQGSESRLATSIGFADDAAGSATRLDLFTQYVRNVGRRWKGKDGVSVYGAAAFSTGEGRAHGLSNVELGATYIRELGDPGDFVPSRNGTAVYDWERHPRSRLLVRAGAILPTASDAEAVPSLRRAAVAHRLADAVLFAPRSSGARISGSYLLAIPVPAPWPRDEDDVWPQPVQFLPRVFARVDAGVDLPRLADEVQAWPRAGVGLGLVGSVLALTVEGTTIRMPAVVGGDAAFHYSVASTLRFVFPFDPIYRVQPGVTAAVPIGDDAGWVIAFDLQLLGGGTHDPLWHRPAEHW